MYSLTVDKKVLKQIRKLHPNDREAAVTILDRLPKIFSASKQSPHLKKLRDEPNAWRYRKGDVRILFYQNKKQKQLEIYKVGYRSGIYS